MTNVSEDHASEEIRDAFQINGDAVRGHLDELVRSTVEETLNQMLDAEADQLCGAKRYERSPGTHRGSQSSRRAAAIGWLF